MQLSQAQATITSAETKSGELPIGNRGTGKRIRVTEAGTEDIPTSPGSVEGTWPTRWLAFKIDEHVHVKIKIMFAELSLTIKVLVLVIT